MTPQLRTNINSLERELAMLVEGNHPNPSMATPGLQPIADKYGDLMRQNWAENVAAGTTQTPVQPTSDLGYLTRQATEEKVALGAKGNRLSPSQVPGRQDIFMEPVQLPREGVGINDLSMRGDIASMPAVTARDAVASEYLHQTPKDFQDWYQLRAMPAAQRTAAQSTRLDELNAVFTQAENLANWNRGLDHAKLQQIGGFFANSPLVDMETKFVRNAVNNLKASKGIPEGIASVAQPLSALGAEGVPISNVLVDAGLTYGGQQVANTSAMQNTLTAMQKAGLVPSTATLNDLANFAVPQNVVPMLTKLIKAGTSPEGLNPFLKLWDSITNLNKAFVTQLWPANHTRNQLTALGQNWINNAYYAHIGDNPAGYIAPWMDAAKWQAGKMIEDLPQKVPEFAGMTNEQAWQKLLGYIYDWNVPGGKKQLSKELIGSTFQGAKEMPVLGAPGGSINPLTKIAQAVPSSLEEAIPWNVAGVGERTRDVFAPVKDLIMRIDTGFSREGFQVWVAFNKVF